MKPQEQEFSPALPKADRQALTCIAIVSLAGCALIVVFGLLVWSLAPQVYPWIAAQVARLIAGPVLYVKPDGASRTCTSWENACGLQTALLTASASDEIWVKAGIYRPAADTRSPGAAFWLRKGVAIYGGFAGTETTRDQ